MQQVLQDDVLAARNTGDDTGNAEGAEVVGVSDVAPEVEVEAVEAGGSFLGDNRVSVFDEANFDAARVRAHELLEGDVDFLTHVGVATAAGGGQAPGPMGAMGQRYSDVLVPLLLCATDLFTVGWMQVWMRRVPPRLWWAVVDIVRNTPGFAGWSMVLRTWWEAQSRDGRRSLPQLVHLCHFEHLTGPVQEGRLRWEFGDRPVEDFMVLNVFQRGIVFRRWQHTEADMLPYGLPVGPLPTPSEVFTGGGFSN